MSNKIYLLAYGLEIEHALCSWIENQM